MRPMTQKTSGARRRTTERSRVLNKIADAIEENLEMLAVAESWENGKPVRETIAADIPLAADHFRYFASVIRAEEGGISEIDKDTVAYHFHEPLGVVGPDHPVQLPAADGGLEAGACSGGRKLRGPQAGQPDPLVDPQVGRADRGDRPAGRPQHRQRPRC